MDHQDVIPAPAHEDTILSPVAVTEAMFVTFNDSNATMDWWVVGMEPANSSMIIETERAKTTDAKTTEAVAEESAGVESVAEESAGVDSVAEESVAEVTAQPAVADTVNTEYEWARSARYRRN